MPSKLLTSPGFVGDGNFTIASIFLGSAETPFSDNSIPSKSRSDTLKRNLPAFNVRHFSRRRVGRPTNN